MSNPLETQQTYQEYVDKKSPNSPIWKNCCNAFRVGGLICSIGGQTGLNLGMQLARKGILEECRVELLGTNAEAIEKAD